MRSEPFDATRAAGFEQLANVFASSVALHYAKILVGLKIKNGKNLVKYCWKNQESLYLCDCNIG